MLHDDGSSESVNEVVDEEPGPSKVTPVRVVEEAMYPTF